MIGILLMALNSCQKEKGERKTPIKTKVDSIISIEQLAKFVSSIDTNYSHFKYDSIINFNPVFSSSNCPQLAACANITKTFLKADFDNNGYNDLLVISRFEYFEINLFTIFGFKDGFKIKPFTNGNIWDCKYPELTAIDNLPAINIFSYERSNVGNSIILKTKLIYKYGNFIEYNSKPKNHKIQKILVEVSPCMGKCPNFKLDIDADGNANLDAIAYNYVNYPNLLNEIKGKFTTKIRTEQFNELITLLNYLDFENLKDKYSVGSTDDATIDIKIIYDNGREKRIHDYGLMGTHGLDRLYHMIKELRFNQDWKNDTSANPR